MMKKYLALSLVFVSQISSAAISQNLNPMEPLNEIEALQNLATKEFCVVNPGSRTDLNDRACSPKEIKLAAEMNANATDRAQHAVFPAVVGYYLVCSAFNVGTVINIRTMKDTDGGNVYGKQVIASAAVAALSMGALGATVCLPASAANYALVRILEKR